MTNSRKLKSVMVARGMTLSDLSSLTGLSKASLSYKINNHRQFLAKEILILQKALNLTSLERDEIFFANDVE